mgnify:CR=1 FL=1
MASSVGAVWAIDIGNNSLKALHLSNERGVVEVVGFDNIQHGRVLTGSGVTAAEKNELVAISLRRFVEQNDLGKDDIVVSVPSQNSFARFVNLPPVEPKRIPEIVRFEAAQQIPFDINEVQWDWQMMSETGGSENKVGIFAVKNDVVDSVLEHFDIENMTVRYVQMAPMALYNCVLYDCADLDNSENQAIIALDIGAENTDLVVCTRSTVWQRCIPMGGNAFTRTVVDTFKLSFERAEKLKRTAPMSKYARQIFQAMRPVFTDLASEVQRSLNFYNSSNPNTKLLKVIALGGGTKMRGLLKYLRQTLQIPVERPDSFKKLAMGSGVSTAKFHENVSDFGVVYGLALQGLGLAKIESNLLPRSVARSAAWASKAKYFTAAACVLLLVSLMCFTRVKLDEVNYKNNNQYRAQISSVISAVEQAGRKLKEQESKGRNHEAIIEKAFQPFIYRNVVPLLHQTIISTLPNKENNPEQKELYEAFDNGDVKTVKNINRKERKQIFVTNLLIRFEDDVELAPLGEVGFVRVGSRKQEGELGEADDRFEMEAMRGLGAGAGSKYDRKRFIKKDKAGVVEAEGGAGFVVTIEGYSPYEHVGELMDPVGVEDDRSKWGVITRLMHLDDIVDGNSPFELYKKLESKHFKLETGEIDLDAEMPAGIGIVDFRPEKAGSIRPEYSESGERVLIDPMTKEIIGKDAELDENKRVKINGRTGKPIYKVNDHWFVLKLKFTWKDAPKIDWY